jgi:MoaA/NifB/PqqE/SkfB family radical SAM enzyme
MIQIYIRLTEQCNMECAHCCFSATRKRSAFMSREVFNGAIQLVSELETTCTIGGGEPTLHPEFQELISWAVSNLPQFPDDFDECVPSVHCVTNGKRTENALWLARQARLMRVSARLSQDPFHDPINPKVVRAFDPRSWEEDDDLPDCLEPKMWRNFNTLYSVHALGRGKNIPHALKLDDCVCSSIFVQPDGSVYSCGCLTEYIGRVDELSALVGRLRDTDSNDNYALGECCGSVRLKHQPELEYA